MRSPRFRLFTLLIAVMLAGVACKGYVLWQRSAEYRRRAEDAETQEGCWREVMRLIAGNRDYAPRVAHYARLAVKYRQAARRPWLPVEPDPPEPD